ncbi:MAG: DUF2993 domain-containing protein [Actinomycetia bacterium]|nr:DUF2993 domain-containing protein [Actinomycetes bacterium]
MRTVFRVLVGLVVLVAAAQLVVPTALAGELAQALEPLTGPGSRDTVKLAAIPFWELASGRFQDLQVTTVNGSAGPLKVAWFSADWQDGGVDPAAWFGRHQLVVTRTGRLTAQIRVDGAALAAILADSGRVTDPTVTVRPDGLVVAGRVNLGALQGPVTMRGNLVIAPNGRQLLFVPTSVDGYALPFGASIVVFDVSRLGLPFAVRLTGVRLVPPDVELTAAAP